MRLERWSLRSRPYGRWESPEEAGVCLFGHVMGHPLHQDGKEVLTTAVLHLGLDCIVTKSGSEYELGTVDPDYEQRYPRAEQRLVRALNQSQPAPPVLSCFTPGQDWAAARECPLHR